MIKYLFNNHVFVDFDFIQATLQKSKSSTYRILRNYIQNKDVEIISHKNKRLYADSAITELIESVNKKSDSKNDTCK